MTRIIDTLHEGQCTLIITPRCVLFRMQNMSENKCRKNKNTHFLQLFPKIVPFIRYVDKCF